MNTRSMTINFLINSILLYMVLLAVMSCGDDKLDPKERAFLEQVRKSLENNATAAEKAELLFEAVAQGYMYVAELLLEHGADINASDGWGQTPLFYAVDSNNEYLARLLIKNGVDVNVKDKENRTPLYYAFQPYSWPMIELLIDNKAKVDPDDEYFYKEFKKAVKEGDVQLVRLLIRAGVDVTKEKGDGESLILLAALSHEDKTIFQMLIEAVPEIKLRTRLVTAEDGLRMRDKPTMEGEVLYVIPFEDSVLVLEEQEDEMTIGGKTGVWSLVQWNEQTGWVFGGFLTESITCIINIDGEDMEAELFKGTKEEFVEMFKNYTLKNIEVTASNGFLFIAFRIGYDRYDVLYHDFCCEYGDLIFESSNRITFIPNSELLVMNMGGPEMEKLIKGKTTFHVWMKKNDSDLIMLKSDALTLYFKRRTDENTKN
jgi:hypothetical protein